MGSYSLAFRASVAKDLRDLPSDDLVRVLKRIESLASEPRPPGSEKLSAGERYRVRQGSYRVLYEIDDTDRQVLIVKVAHRREAYRRS